MLTVRMGRNGGVQQLELSGMVSLHIANEKWGRIRVQLDNQDTKGVQLQTHPNIDKELFKMRSQVSCFVIQIVLEVFLLLNLMVLFVNCLYLIDVKC